MNSLARFFDKIKAEPAAAGAKTLDYDRSVANPANSQRIEPLAPLYRFHVYSTKHNTHITLAKPDQGAIISVATGKLGFRKANRGSYDAAYQLAAHVLNRMRDEGLLHTINRIELVLRGYGRGREAVTKALLGSEGRYIRSKFAQVTDATRVKFGGTRSPAPRRLG